MLNNGEPAEYFHVTWTPALARRLRVKIGDPAGQTLWEYLTVLLSLMTWASKHRRSGLHLQGDNLAALGGVLNLTGKDKLTAVTKELTWRKVRQSWNYDAAHLPTEANLLSDALSRLSAPAGSERKNFPEPLRTAIQVPAPDLDAMWVCS